MTRRVHDTGCLLVARHVDLYLVRGHIWRSNLAVSLVVIDEHRAYHRAVLNSRPFAAQVNCSATASLMSHGRLGSFSRSYAHRSLTARSHYAWPTWVKVAKQIVVHQLLPVHHALAVGQTWLDARVRANLTEVRALRWWIIDALCTWYLVLQGASFRVHPVLYGEVGRWVLGPCYSFPVDTFVSTRYHILASPTLALLGHRPNGCLTLRGAHYHVSTFILPHLRWLLTGIIERVIVWKAATIHCCMRHRASILWMFFDLLWEGAVYGTIILLGQLFVRGLINCNPDPIRVQYCLVWTTGSALINSSSPFPPMTGWDWALLLRTLEHRVHESIHLSLIHDALVLKILW